VQLWTVISVPRGEGPFPTVLHRTPYGTGSWEGNANFFNKYGFAYVTQDQRGAQLSSGNGTVQWTFWRADGQDHFDTHAWIAAQPWSNGRVYLYGGSADGITIYTASQFQPPQLNGIAAVVPSGELHATTYQGGAYRVALIAWWLTLNGFGYVEPDLFAHEAFDSWWDTVQLRGKQDRCTFPGVHFGGWWDIFANETISAFNLYQDESTDPRCKGQHYFVFDAHGHCGGGDYAFPPTARSGIATDLMVYIFRTQEGLPVSPALQARVASTKPITFYVMGPNNTQYGDFWTTLSNWPAYTPRPYYLQADGELTPAPPASSATPPRTYSYDPAAPVRTVGGPELLLRCGPRDQAAVLGRDDVLLFTSTAFTEPTPIVGPIKALLYVSTDRNDTDFTVKIMDRYPDGRFFLIGDGVVRLRWRDGPLVAHPAVPGQVYNVTVDLWPTAYVIEPGHAISVAVSSSNFPRFSVNRNSGWPMATEKDGPVYVAKNSVYVDATRPSQIILPVVTFDDIPDNFTP